MRFDGQNFRWNRLDLLLFRLAVLQYDANSVIMPAVGTYSSFWINTDTDTQLSLINILSCSEIYKLRTVFGCRVESTKVKFP